MNTDDSENTCEWFALCANPATTTEPHPILGEVPICDRCQAKAHRLREAGQRPVRQSHIEHTRRGMEETSRYLGESRDV